VIRLFPQSPPPGATLGDRLRYVRRLSIHGLVVGLPVWALLFYYTQAAWAIIAFVVVNAYGLLNILYLTRKIQREEGAD